VISADLFDQVRHGLNVGKDRQLARRAILVKTALLSRLSTGDRQCGYNNHYANH
jgi:hypothetical protein